MITLRLQSVNGRNVDTAQSESDHRIANHLEHLASLVQLQRSTVLRGPETLGREQVGSILNDLAGKIVSVGHFHRTLAKHHNAPQIDLGEYLADTCSVLVSRLGLASRLQISYALECGCQVTAEQAQSVAMIANEILMNSVKYAHPTGLRVQLRVACQRTLDCQIVVEIEDDGIGLPEGFDPAKEGGLGFALIRSLASSLGATVNLTSDTLGTCFRFVFPSVDCPPDDTAEGIRQRYPLNQYPAA